MSVMADMLQAARLNLRVFKDSDANELHEIFSDPATHTIGDGAIADMDFTRDWIRRRHQRHPRVWRGVVLGAAGRGPEPWSETPACSWGGPNHTQNSTSRFGATINDLALAEKPQVRCLRKRFEQGLKKCGQPSGTGTSILFTRSTRSDSNVSA